MLSKLFKSALHEIYRVNTLKRKSDSIGDGSAEVPGKKSKSEFSNKSNKIIKRKVTKRKNVEISSEKFMYIEWN